MIVTEPFLAARPHWISTTNWDFCFHQCWCKRWNTEKHCDRTDWENKVCSKYMQTVVNTQTTDTVIQNSLKWWFMKVMYSDLNHTDHLLLILTSSAWTWDSIGKTLIQCSFFLMMKVTFMILSSPQPSQDYQDLAEASGGNVIEVNTTEVSNIIALTSRPSLVIKDIFHSWIMLP